jgi:hypothetical protein
MSTTKCFFLLLSFSLSSTAPVSVYYYISFNSIVKISSEKQTFHADLYLSCVWLDNSLNRSVSYNPQQDWSPGIEFTNSVGLIQQVVQEPTYILPSNTFGADVFMPAGTWVKADYRFLGEFLVSLDLSRFPVDSQALQIDIESSIHDVDQLVFANPLPGVADNIVGSELSLLEWKLGSRRLQLSTFSYPIFQQEYSRLSIVLVIGFARSLYSQSPDRFSGYYMSKIVLGVVLLVLSGLLSVIISPKSADRMAAQLRFGLTLFLYSFRFYEAPIICVAFFLAFQRLFS